MDQKIYKMMAKAASFLCTVVLLCLGTAVWGAAGIHYNAADPHYAKAENLESFEDMRVKVLGGHVRMTRRWTGSQWEWNSRWKGISHSGRMSIAQMYENQINEGSLLPQDLEADRQPPGKLFRAGQSYRLSSADDDSITYENLLKRFIVRKKNGFEWYDLKGNKIDYDRYGRIIAYRDRNDVKVSIVRDANGYIQQIQDHFGQTVINYHWEADPSTAPRLNLQGDSYQPQRLHRLSDHDGRSVIYHYNSAGQLIRITDVLGENWHLTYNDEGTLNTITDPDARATQYVINKEGRVHLIEDHDGNSVRYEYRYDERKSEHYRSAQYSSGKIVETWYDEVGIQVREAINGEQQEEVSVTLSNGAFSTYPLAGYYESAILEEYLGSTLINTSWLYCDTNIPGSCPCMATSENSCDSPDQRYELTIGDGLDSPSGVSVLYIKYRQYKDAAGRMTYREFDQWGNLIKITYPDGTTETTTWNTQYSLPLTHTDERGTVTAYEYDDKGNLLTLTEAQGTADERVTRYVYDQYGQVLEMTTGESAAGNTELATTAYEYDDYGNLNRLTDPLGNITIYTDYDVLGNARTIKDARAHKAVADYRWTRTYDAVGNLLSDLNPEGEGETFTYTSAGDILTLASATTGTYTLKTNARSLPTAVVDPDEHKTTLEYDRQYRLTGVVDALGHSQRLYYNPQDQPSKVIDGEGNEIRLEYEHNQLKSIHYPTYSETLDYDARERVRQRSRAGNDRQYYTRYQYDKTGNLNQHTDAKGQPEQYEHDRLGRLVKIIDAEQGETLLAYDARDNLLSVTDPEGRVTSYRYNRNDQRSAEIKPAAEPASERQYDYDANGNLVEEITPAGEVKRYKYDRANRLVATTLYASEQAQQPVKRVSYQVAGRSQYRGYQQTLGEDVQNRTADIQALSESYTYNHLGQVTSVTVNFGAFSKTYQYTYHPNGLKKTYTTPEGITYTYYYNKNNQFTAVHIPGSGQLSRGNFYWLQPQTLLLPGGSQVTLSYDDFLQVKERILQDPEQTNIAQALYDYDAVGDITAIDTEHGQYSFGYDSLYRLTGADYPANVAANDEKSTSNSLPRKRGRLQDVGGRDESGTETERAGEGVSAKGTTISDEQFTYDGVGNRTTHTQTPEEEAAEELTATYNNLNQLVSQIQNGVETTFTYNANGHTQTKTTGSDTTEYVYNHEERLIAVKTNGTTVGEYAYNPLGQRIKKTVNGQTTWYLYNDEGLAAEYNASGQLIAEYHFTPYSTWMTEPLFQRKSGQVYYYQNDHLGTPQRMINSGGEVVWEARYSAFGEAQIITETISNNLRFPGQYFDSETGLHHNFHRDYDPATGRYVQGDPIGLGGGNNIYIYAVDGPLKQYDPTGLNHIEAWDHAWRPDSANTQAPGEGFFGGSCGPEGSKLATWIPDMSPDECAAHDECYDECGKSCKGVVCKTKCDLILMAKNPLYGFMTYNFGFSAFYSVKDKYEEDCEEC